MSASQQRLLGLLADGEVHSGSELAAELGVSRTAVWKHIGQIDALGLSVNATAGQGYQLATPLELLDAQPIAAEFSDSVGRVCGAPLVLWESDSTSDYLLSLDPPVPGNAHVCFAEYQAAGRGRRGRQWFAPAGHGICLSVGWTFVTSPENLSCLGLAAGVAMLRALSRCGLQGVQLKWPNDLVFEGRKLAGILIDVQGEAGGPLYVVAGVGVNYQLDETQIADVQATGGLAPAAVSEIASTECGRNRLAGLLADELVNSLRLFGEQGFAPFVADWQAADYLAGQPITVSAPDGERQGVANGITPDGRLKLLSQGTEHLYVSGDISVRPEAGTS